MWWIIIISVIVIVGLAFWMMSGKKEGSEVSDMPVDEPESSAPEEVVEEAVEEEVVEEVAEEDTTESSEEDKPTM